MADGVDAADSAWIVDSGELVTIPEDVVEALEAWSSLGQGF